MLPSSREAVKMLSTLVSSSRGSQCVLILTLLRFVRSKRWSTLERRTTSSSIPIRSWNILGGAWGVQLWWGLGLSTSLSLPWLSPSLCVNTLPSNSFRYWPSRQIKLRHTLPNWPCCVSIRCWASTLVYRRQSHLSGVAFEILRRELYGLLILMGFGLIWMDCTLFTLLHIHFAKTTDLHRFC